MGADSKSPPWLYQYQGVTSRYTRLSVWRRRAAVPILAGLTFLLFFWHAPREYARITSLPCQRLPGANDAVVVMRTGVTQIEAALPVHLETTLQCSSNTVIFSDHEEIFEGEYKVRDVLANVDPMIRQNSEDFELYRRVKTVGRDGLDPADVTGERATSKTDKDTKVQIAGWVLDKWKFLPMLTETFHLHPRKKWYIFIETDSYLFWSTTLKYLSTLDHTQPHCIGHRSTVKSPHPFMHGGSGFMLSNAAIKLVVDYIKANQADLDKLVASEWAGDIALGLVFKEAGIPLTGSWPIYQPHHFGVIDFSVDHLDKRFWCYPAGSFHHMTSDGIRDVWNFEQAWIKNNEQGGSKTFIRYADVFSNVIMPRIRFPRQDWDNQCTDIQEDVTTIEECQNVCMDDSDCLQYSFDPKSRQCNTSDSPKFGEASLGTGLYSDWIFDRVEQWRDDQEPCSDESFIQPEESAAEL